MAKKTSITDRPNHAVLPEVPSARSSVPFTGPAMWVETVSKLICLWVNRHNQRRELARMEAYRYEDIGRTLPEVRRECKKWFWQK